MNCWPPVRDALYVRLHNHVKSCALCQPCAVGLHVHSACENGILLLTEWHLAKCHAETSPACPTPPTNHHEATP